MTKCIVEPISRKELRLMAKLIRKIEGTDDKLFFDIVHFLEVTLPQIDDTFIFRVLDRASMGECHGLTYPDRNEIQIREDVYLRASEGIGRDRLTMSHELLHLLRHEKKNVSFARVGEGNIVPYRDPEWQADAFGGELLVPYHLVGGLSAEEISKYCGVSLSAASYQLSKYQ